MNAHRFHRISIKHVTRGDSDRRFALLQEERGSLCSSLDQRPTFCSTVIEGGFLPPTSLQGEGESIIQKGKRFSGYRRYRSP